MVLGPKESANSWLPWSNQMSAAYDSYDYTAYWDDRTYEHESEVATIRDLMGKIPEINRILEIGAGFGRLTPYYMFRARSVSVTEPSIKLLNQAKKRLNNYKNITFTQSTIENLPNKFRPRSFDAIIMVRVFHHISNITKALQTMEKLLTPDGYVIFEFANKMHFKAVITNLLKRNFAFIKDTQSVDVRSEKSKKAKTIAFLNHHPQIVLDELKNAGFKVLEVRSVSNIRSPLLKKHLPISFMLWIEKLIQKPLSLVYFGPSIFVLAKKRG